MANQALREQHERFARVESVRLGGVPVAVEWLPYGVGAETPAADIVATYGLLELEYGAFRRSAAVMDRVDRATLMVTGADRVEFLNRMVTQELKDLGAGQVRRALWLNRKGRIQADLLISECGTHIVIDVDCHDAAATVRTLREFIFSEDVQIRDASDEWRRLSVHGPAAVHVLAMLGASAEAVEPLERADGCCLLTANGVHCLAARNDQCATLGVELWAPAAHAAAVFDALMDVPEPQQQGRKLVRPAGWYAYNMARIEGGTPLFHVDFGPDNLPHESGVLHQRTSFKKGCYLGQEIVARMESLGKPKQQLVSLRVMQDCLPTAGSPVLEQCADGALGSPVGAVTSSALSPLLGSAPVAFAMVKSSHAAPGTVLIAPAEGERTEVVVRDQLAFVDMEGARLP